MTTTRAVTLVELLVVLVLLGLVAGFVGLTIHTSKPITVADPVRSAIAAARDSAIRTGRRVTVVLRVNDAQRQVTAIPDGRVLADSALDINPLTGKGNGTR